jgi:hypothetical protein
VGQAVKKSPNTSAMTGIPAKNTFFFINGSSYLLITDPAIFVKTHA